MKSSQPFHAGCIIVSVEVLRLRELDDYQLEAFPKLEEGRRDWCVLTLSAPAWKVDSVLDDDV